jgi:hypothetical protein
MKTKDKAYYENKLKELDLREKVIAAKEELKKMRISRAKSHR